MTGNKMLNVDDLNLSPNRKTRTRIAVVATDADGNKTYFRSVATAAKEFGVTSTAVKTAAIMKIDIQDKYVELVPASAVEEFLPQRLYRRRTEKRERGIVVTASVDPATYKRLMEVALHTGIPRAKLARAAIEAFVATYEQTDQTNT